MSKYKIVRELGCNREGGRITYLATDTSVDPPQEVVIKKFRFALAGAKWSGFKAYEREIEVLQELEHPRIPRYLNSFETKLGFCLIQEYKNAFSLTERCSFTAEQIQQIAISVLEILVYLQCRVPPIIHRDIKPENILVSDREGRLDAYLVDFGFARIRGGEVALSSIAVGTPGFMPPEEMFNRPLTEASDLYSLGVTLIGLLTGTRSVDIGNLIDDNYRLKFKHLVPQISPIFIAWLEKMVAPNVKERFKNATVALNALKRIKVKSTAAQLETPARLKKRRKPTPGLGLATISAVAVLGTPFVIYQQQSTVRKLLATHNCQRCNLQDATLENADLKLGNLAGANLMGANLVGTNLVAAYLEEADLRDATLEKANLSLVNLRSANLKGASLGGVSLRSAYLENANLAGANLAGANLTNANLAGANLAGANLTNANLAGADLMGANLKDASLWFSILEEGNLGKGNLGGANLGGANLREANLAGARLKGAHLMIADLDGADLEGADLEGADLSRANLRGANLKNTNLKDATMPDGTKHQ
jgi:uncharacterized protein YjbI with pentapeptide repeats/serine/threonine protein kinase